ncbi:MAG TPA: hypothetical protein VEK08_23875 [Planctomycetota bacterium]|nr:hypothetical protein [Planctomycetota bacterium]
MRLQIVFLAAAAALLWTTAGCKGPRNENAPAPGHNLRKVSQKPGLDERRELFAQIVEDDIKESAIIEGKPFKWFLKSCAATTHDDLRKSGQEDVLFQQLMDQPGMYRGQVVTLTRGVIVEVTKAPLPAEYGLPGYSVLPAIFVDSTHDVYALRILCPPESKLFEKLRKGIEEDAFPVLRISGYFMKLYARKTNREGEPPWQRPLLICPEPEFSQVIEPRKVWDDMRTNKVDDLLPSERVDAPGAEERMLVQISVARSATGSEVRTYADGEPVGADLKASIASAVANFKKRLPKDQVAQPAAVVLLSGSAPKDAADKAIAALRAAGVQRLAIKRER